MKIHLTYRELHHLCNLCAVGLFARLMCLIFLMLPVIFPRKNTSIMLIDNVHLSVIHSLNIIPFLALLDSFGIAGSTPAMYGLRSLD